MRNQMQNWMSDVFGMDVVLHPTTLRGAAIDSRFDYWTVSGLLTGFVLITPKPGVPNPPVLEIARLVYEVRNQTPHWVAYGCLSLSAVERRRLLWRQTAFVVTGRQIFLPFFGIALRDDSDAPARNWLGRVVQELLLSHLEGRIKGLFREHDVVTGTSCSRASAFRALRELTAFGLVERVPGGYTFVPHVEQTLRMFMPRLRKSSAREALIAAVLAYKV